jgi:hypothetical protein
VTSERLTAAQKAVDEQWAKYDAAVGSVPHVALVQINRKLVRLEHERDKILDEERERG